MEILIFSRSASNPMDNLIHRIRCAPVFSNTLFLKRHILMPYKYLRQLLDCNISGRRSVSS